MLTLYINSSASSAVIIRMPFLHTFSNPDFLCRLIPISSSSSSIFLLVLTMACLISDATTDLALWTNIEVGLGILASSLATLRPLFRVVRKASREMPTDDCQHSNNIRLNGYKRRPNSPFEAQVVNASRISDWTIADRERGMMTDPVCKGSG